MSIPITIGGILACIVSIAGCITDTDWMKAIGMGAGFLLLIALAFL